MTMTTNKATIGSISTGTLRNEDLLEAFADELERIEKGTVSSEAISALIENARELLDPTVMYELLQEDGPDLVNELQDALNDYAPPFCYFGTLEGDGADFGFWPDHETINELISDSQEYGTTPSHLNHNVTYINIDEGVFIEVNDHGNLTISRIGPGEVLLSIV